MSDEPQAEAAHRSLGSWLGALGMFVAGVAGGLLVGVFTLNGLLNSDSSVTSIVVGSSVLTAVVAIGLWLTGRRPWRVFAAGMALCWAGLVVFVGAGGDDGMSDEEIDQEFSAIRAAGTPAYYLGDEADGNDLATVSADEGGDFGATGTTFGYGFTCGDGGCLSDVTVDTLTASRDFLDAYGCVRLAPVLGVPAATWDSWLLLFTGDSMVRIEDPDLDDDHVGELALASQLRALGQSAPVESLPPPSAELLELVDAACGAA
jgi:drug/metabolite transporter (DMT)-like permease